MRVSLIVAMDKERGIGRNNDLMWHLPSDMKFFKDTTEDQIVVMGRKNYDSIPLKYRPLPKRENVVLTRTPGFEAENCLVFNSLQDCLAHYHAETERIVFIIGGGEIYRLALEADCVQEMFITHIDKVYGADTFFPDFDESLWVKEELWSQSKDENHEASFTVYKYIRKRV